MHIATLPGLLNITDPSRFLMENLLPILGTEFRFLLLGQFWLVVAYYEFKKFVELANSVFGRDCHIIVQSFS